ncbi:hypothetical protein AB1E18_002392 [Capra hircus]
MGGEWMNLEGRREKEESSRLKWEPNGVQDSALKASGCTSKRHWVRPKGKRPTETRTRITGFRVQRAHHYPWLPRSPEAEPGRTQRCGPRTRLPPGALHPVTSRFLRDARGRPRPSLQLGTSSNGDEIHSGDSVKDLLLPSLHNPTSEHLDTGYCLSIMDCLVECRLSCLNIKPICL